VQKQLTILSALAFFFLFVVWAITPVQAHIGEPCPHKDTSHSHCQNVVPADGVDAVVRDVDGRFVGVLLEIGRSGPGLDNTRAFVLRQDGDTAVSFEVTDAGLPENLTTRLEHESPNCIGEALLGGEAKLFANGTPRGTTVYYHPAAFLPPVTLLSYSESPKTLGACQGTGGVLIAPNLCCVPQNVVASNVGPARMIDLSGLVPPFQSEVQE